MNNWVRANCPKAYLKEIFEQKPGNTWFLPAGKNRVFCLNYYLYFAYFCPHDAIVYGLWCYSVEKNKKFNAIKTLFYFVKTTPPSISSLQLSLISLWTTSSISPSSTQFLQMYPSGYRNWFRFEFFYFLIICKNSLFFVILSFIIHKDNLTKFFSN